jgi:hypothetical protein
MAAKGRSTCQSPTFRLEVRDRASPLQLAIIIQDMPAVKARSTRSKSNVNKNPSPQKSNTPSKRTNRQKRAPPTPPSEDGQAVSGPEDASDTYQEENEDDDDVKSLHSDALDDDSDQETRKTVKKRKRVSPIKPRRAKASSPRKKRKNANSDEDEEGEGYDLKEGQQVVGRVVQAPKTGRGKHFIYTATRLTHSIAAVPPGQISQNTFNFLLQLKKPECNDREW